MDSNNIEFLQPDDLNNLKRFNETCEDSQPYDVPKEKMHRLAKLGVVRRHSRSYYSITSFGMYVLNQDDDAYKLPLKTACDDERELMNKLKNRL